MEETRFSLEDPADFKRKTLLWADHFATACVLDSNAYPMSRYQRFEALIAVDALEFLSEPVGSAFAALERFKSKTNSWLFGYFSYDLKNEIESLESNHPDRIGFPLLYFFRPRYLIKIQDGAVFINRNYPEAFEIYSAIISMNVPEPSGGRQIEINHRIAKEDYIAKVSAIRQHIIEGDLYEMNLCQELYAEPATINPAEVFLKLNRRSKAPHACYFKCEGKYLICSSPERFLKKKGRKLISQPIKGTIRRGASGQEDELLRNQLQSDIKERAENVMIVDLVRNDLSKSSLPGSVVVEELFGIYSFEQVNQMISTVTSELKHGVNGVEAIKNAFPMGSMTGAPKIMAMQLIERYEASRRGLYSGAIGYFDPDGDFDFNVVIRSILYNAASRYLSISVGGAITYHSDPEREYEECLLKARAMIESLKE